MDECTLSLYIFLAGKGENFPPQRKRRRESRSNLELPQARAGGETRELGLPSLPSLPTTSTSLLLELKQSPTIHLDHGHPTPFNSTSYGHPAGSLAPLPRPPPSPSITNLDSYFLLLKGIRFALFELPSQHP